MTQGLTTVYMPPEGHSQLFCESHEHSSRLTAAAQAIQAYYFKNTLLSTTPAGTNPALILCRYQSDVPVPILEDVALCSSNLQNSVGSNPTLALLCGSNPHLRPAPIRHLAVPIRYSSEVRYPSALSCSQCQFAFT